jgi:hypothetical protein
LLEEKGKIERQTDRRWTDKTATAATTTTTTTTTAATTTTTTTTTTQSAIKIAADS